MTYGIGTPDDFIPSNGGRLSRKIVSQTVPGAVILAMTVLVGPWMLHMRPVPVTSRKVAKAPTVTPAVTVASNPYGALFDPRFSSGSTPVSLAESFPLQSSFESISPAPTAVTAEPENVPPITRPAVSQFAESVPVPQPRPPEFGSLASRGPFHASGRRFAQQNRTAIPPATPANSPSFFEKLFGTLQQPSGPVLAYAAPEDGVLGNARRITPGPLPRYDRWTAVYDIAAHTVYLPNGTRLEAHSGLRDRLDDPRYVNERMRGATPPNVYELQPREQLFHGVPALRLIPVNGADPYGRTGLLAHTFMLGPNGDSNGCVSFRNYNAFLQAYRNGEIKRLAVVARLD